MSGNVKQEINTLMVNRCSKVPFHMLRFNNYVGGPTTDPTHDFFYPVRKL